MNTAWRQRLRATTALQAAATAALLAAPVPAAAQPAPNARPTGGQVVAGQASIGQSATTTTINQSSQRAAVNWRGFDVGSQQSVQFQQPSSSAVTLNRVVGSNPSQIAGKIQANGQLVIVNQSGVVFHNGSQVNAAGLVVSTAGISDSNFMAGKMVFDQAGRAGAMIENRGTITVKDHGLAALVAPQVRNSGKISAKLGTVILAGAEAETLDLYGDGLVSINVTKQVHSAPDGTKALVTNTGVISAQGGSVVLTADAVDGVVQTLVDAGGKISANSTAGRTGTVLISGSGGDVLVEGVVSAQGRLAGTTGGAVQVSGSGVTVIAAGARINASGKAGGGTIALGTTLARAARGSGTAAATTGSLVVNKGAKISANATAQGHGGRVVALSTNSTTMAGTITAQGGKTGGDGGFVEISGGAVTLTGHVDASAPKGLVGTLLLDPSDLWVSDTKPAVATYTVTGGDLPTIPAGGAPNGATVSWVSPTLLASQNANISLAATDNLYVASSYGTGNVLNLGSYTLSLTGGTGLTVDRGFTINASSISLTSLAGPITLGGASGVTAGLITAPQLANLSDTALTASTITMAGAGGIALGGAVLGTALHPLTTLDLSSSGGSVTQDAGGVVYATTLTSAGNVSGSVDLAGTGNQIANLGALVATSGITLNDDVATLTVTGAVNGGGSIAIANTGSLVLRGDLTATGTVTLDAVGIAQYTTTTITADVLTGDAGSGYASLGATNAVQHLGAFSAQQGFGLIDDVASLQVIGAVNGGPGGVYLVNTGSLAIDAPLTSTGPVELFANGITQDIAGVITAGTLTGDAGAGAAHLGIAANAVTDLDVFDAAQGFGLRNDTPVLTVTGAVNGGSAVYLVNTGSVVIGAPVTATGIVDLVGEGMSQTAAGTITAGTLIGNAGTGAAHLGIATNDVTSLGAFTAGQGFGLRDDTPVLTVTGAVNGGTSVYLVNTGSLAIDAPITASGTVDLVGNGITQNIAGTISAATLMGDAGTGAAHLGIAANDVTNLGPFTAQQGLGLNDNVSLLTVTGAVDGGSAVYIVNTGSLVLRADLTAAGTVALDAVGIAQYSTTAITADVLTGTAGSGYASLGGTNHVQQLGPFSALASFALVDDVASLHVIGAINGGSVGILLDNTGSLEIGAPVTSTGRVALYGNGITQDAAGVITAGTLTGGAGAGAAHLGIATNVVTDLDIFDAEQGFGLRDNVQVLTVTGAVNGGIGTYIVNTGSVAIDAPIASTGTVSLIGNGIAQTSAGTITAAVLIGNAGTGAADLGAAANDVTNLGPFVAEQGFALNDSVSLLTVTGAVDGGTAVTLVNTGGLALAAPVTATGTVDLVGNGITQTAAGIVTADTLTGDAGTGAAHLGVATNVVTNLGSFIAEQGFGLRDSVSLLTVTGAVDGGSSVHLVNTGSVSIAAPVAATGIVDLVSNGITQTDAGPITAGTLTGSFGAGAAILINAPNQVTNLGPVSAGYFGLLSDVPVLTVTGPVDGGLETVIGSYGSLVIGAPISGSNTVGLVALMDIAQTAAGVITTDTLVGYAGGAVHLGVAVNDVANLGGFTAEQGFGFRDGVKLLTVSDAVDGGRSVYLVNTGSLAVAAPVTASGTVSLVANGIAQTDAGTISAGTLIGNAGAGAADLGAASNVVTNLGPFAASTGFTLNDAVASTLTVAGAVDGGTGVAITTKGSLAIDAPVTGSGVVDLVSADGISQTQSGVIAAGTLIGDAGTGAATLGAATNLVQNLGPFSAPLGFALTDGVPLLTVVGAIGGGPSIHLVNSGSLEINAPLTAANTVDLVADGIGQNSAGVIATNTLTGNAGGGAADLTAATNVVPNLGPFDAGAGFAFNDSTPLLTVAGAVNGGFDISIANTGSLFINAPITAPLTTTLVADGIGQSAAGAVTAVILTGSAGGGAADFYTAANQVNALASFSAPGGFSLNNNTGTLTVIGAIDGGPFVTLTNTGGLAIDAPIDPSNTVTLTANGISQNAAGVITAGTLTGTAGSGDAELASATNMVVNLGPFTAGGEFQFLDGVGLSVIAGVAAGSNAAITVTGDGNGLTVNPGVTVLAAGGGAALTASGGTLFNDGTLHGGTFASLTAGADIDQHGLVRGDGGPVTETAGGAIDHDGTTQAVNGDATLLAGGAITQSGTVTGGADVTLYARGYLTQSNLVTAGQDAYLYAYGSLEQSGTVTAGGDANLTAIHGTLNQYGVVTAGNAATLFAENDLAQTGAVTAVNGSASLTAGGTLLQTGTVTSGTDVDLTAKTGTLEQFGQVTAGANANLTATNGTLNQTALVSAGNSASLTAGSDLNQTGTVQADGDATLTAGADLRQSQIVTAGHDATLTAINGNLTQTGSITAGTSAIVQALAGNVGEGGTVTAPNIQVAAPNGQVNFTGTFAGVQPDPSLDPRFKLKQGTFPNNVAIGAWISGSVIAVAPTEQVLGAGGGRSQLVVRLTTPNGTVDFPNFQNPQTQLYLDLGTGTASGQIAVDALQVEYVKPGTTQTIDLIGTVNGQSGFNAAASSFIQPLQKANYQVNGCPIGSANCFQFTTLTLPVINPLKDLEISTPEQADDILIILPDVGDRDY